MNDQDPLANTDPVAKAGHLHQSTTGFGATVTYTTPQRTVAVGRIVLFHPGDADSELFKQNGAECHPAIITRVWNDEMVNLMVFPDSGTPVARTSVHVGDPAESSGPLWTWPY